METEQGYVHVPEVYVTEETWGALWHTQADGKPYSGDALMLRLRDLSQLNLTVAALREALPDLSVYSVAQLAAQAEGHNPIDKFYRAPQGLWVGDGEAVDFGEQADFSGLVAGLMFLNAGMLMAGQMLAAVTARKKEIGILKAIGARQREVVAMVLIEALALTMVGALAGFVLVRLAALHQALSNNVALATVLITALKELLMVLAATTTMSLVFGVLPAWRVSKLTVMEVLRSE